MKYFRNTISAAVLAAGTAFGLPSYAAGGVKNIILNTPPNTAVGSMAGIGATANLPDDTLYQLLEEDTLREERRESLLQQGWTPLMIKRMDLFFSRLPPKLRNQISAYQKLLERQIRELDRASNIQRFPPRGESRANLAIVFREFREMVSYENHSRLQCRDGTRVEYYDEYGSIIHDLLEQRYEYLDAQGELIMVSDEIGKIVSYRNAEGELMQAESPPPTLSSSTQNYASVADIILSEEAFQTAYPKPRGCVGDAQSTPREAGGISLLALALFLRRRKSPHK